MSRDAAELVAPRILAVDDESQIHASLRLRLARDYELVFCRDARAALGLLAAGERFDLCFVDIHMPGMDGLEFIEAAQHSDPALGYVVLSAFDTAENLRRAIPLSVYDFIGKPFPERHDFEARIPTWIDRTRSRRREQTLVRHAGAISQDLDSARLEREIELIASETARDALMQTANLLTTIHAHLVSATATLAARAKIDPGSGPLWRNLEEAKKTTAAAASVAEGFFDSAYGSRDSSPALVDSGMPPAIGIAMRMSQAEAANKAVDFTPLDDRLPLRGLSGIDFLLMMVPAIGAALTLTAANTTVGVHGQHLSRLDAVTKDPRLKNYLWLNRRHAPVSQPGLLLTVAATAAPFSRSQAEGWLKGELVALAAVTPRGLIAGLRKGQGLLGLSLAPHADQWQLVLALPT